MIQKDYYKTLGILNTATKTEIENAAKRLGLKFHPSRTNNDPDMNKIFLEIKEAALTLMDEEKKAEYDKYLSITTSKNGFSLTNPEQPNMEKNSIKVEELVLESNTMNYHDEKNTDLMESRKQTKVTAILQKEGIDDQSATENTNDEQQEFQESLLELPEKNYIAIVFLLIITLGIYRYYWYLKLMEDLEIHNLNSKKDIMSLNIIAVILNITIILLSFTTISKEQINGFWGLLLILNVIMAFKTRSLFHSVTKHYEGIFSLSSAYTFWFEIVYLQYRINNPQYGMKTLDSKYFVNKFGTIGGWILYILRFFGVSIGIAFMYQAIIIVIGLLVTAFVYVFTH